MYKLNIICNSKKEFDDVQKAFINNGYIWRSGVKQIVVDCNYPIVIRSDANGIPGKLSYRNIKWSFADGDILIESIKFLRSEKLKRLNSYEKR